jgi:hypothetical protein
VPDPEPPAAGEQLRLKLEQTSPPAEKTATVVTFIDAERAQFEGTRSSALRAAAFFTCRIQTPPAELGR